MTNPKRKKGRRGRKTVANIAGQLAALNEMSIGQLKEKYRELFGVPTRTRNKPYLQKKLAWRIQELAEGGLSDQARSQITTLAPEAPFRWRASNAGGPNNAPAKPKEAPERDPALPPPGTVITREHKGIEHQVTVLDDGFEYRGALYRSLSKIATEITGTKWNGFLFFRLKRRTQPTTTGADR